VIWDIEGVMGEVGIALALFFFVVYQVIVPLFHGTPVFPWLGGGKE
jgi:hypothetical protein